MTKPGLVDTPQDNGYVVDMLLDHEPFCFTVYFSVFVGSDNDFELDVPDAGDGVVGVCTAQRQGVLAAGKDAPAAGLGDPTKVTRELERSGTEMCDHSVARSSETIALGLTFPS